MREKDVLNALREYGLTLAEAGRRYYKRGMTGREFLEAMRTDHENIMKNRR